MRVVIGYVVRYHPQHPPNNDYPTSWTVDSYNSYYWGNNGTSDAKNCGESDLNRPTKDVLGYTGGDSNLCPGTAATADTDYYDHQLTSRTIESLDHAVNAPEHKGKPFAIWIGIRRCANT